MQQRRWLQQEGLSRNTIVNHAITHYSPVIVETETGDFYMLLHAVSFDVSPVNQLGGHEVGLFALGGMLLQVVGKEEELQHDEDDEQLRQDDSP